MGLIILKVFAGMGIGMYLFWLALFIRKNIREKGWQTLAQYVLMSVISLIVVALLVMQVFL